MVRPDSQRGKRTSSKAGREGRFVLAASSTLMFAIASINAAMAAPTGAQFNPNEIKISQQGKTTLIDQSTQRAIINWKGFDVSADEAVRFNQPGVTSSTLNRVTAGQESVIAGRISAPGQVIIYNSNGVVFSGSAKVDVGSLITTTANISDEHFRQGKLIFDQPGNPDARIVNDGSISVAEKGLAAFVAPSVANNGVINARLGTVAMAAGNAATIDLYGDGLVSIAVTDPVTRKPQDAQALVSNGGAIQADGGSVLITAEQASRVVDNAVNLSGVILARGTEVREGSVALVSKSGDIQVAGKIDVSGPKSGGDVLVSGQQVALASTASIDARGAAQGGSVRIGGDFQGRGELPRAKNATLAKGASIDVSATGKGNGGLAVVWSDGNTRMDGRILARGGAQGGNGGLVETSGKVNLSIADSAYVSVAAPYGNGGTWLLDPTTLRIVASGGTSGSVGGANGASGDATVNASVVTGALAGGKVTLSASDRLSVEAPLITSNLGGASRGLELIATGPAGAVDISAPILFRNGSLAIRAGGNISFLSGGTPQTSGIVDLGSGTLWMQTSTAGKISQQAGTALIAANLAGRAGSIDLASWDNYAGNLALQTFNGTLKYRQSNATGVTTSGTVFDPFINQSMTGTAQNIVSSVGTRILEANSVGTTGNYTLTADGNSEFDRLVFTALPYRRVSGSASFPTNDSSDYLVTNLRYQVNGSNVTATPNGGAPSGFTVAAGNGSVTTWTGNWGTSWGVKGFGGVIGVTDELQYDVGTGLTEELIFGLGGKTSRVDTRLDLFMREGAFNSFAERAQVEMFKTTTTAGDILSRQQTATLTANDATRVYGDVNPTLTATMSGINAIDAYVNSQFNDLYQATASTTATQASNVGQYAITGNANGSEYFSQRYQLVRQDGKLTVTPAQLIVSADAKTKVYGDADPTLTYQVSGLKNSDTAAGVLSGNLGRVAGENVGNYGILQGGLGLNTANYTLSYVGNDLRITPAQLNVIADAKTKVYGDLDPALTYQVSGLKRGDTAGAVLNGGSLSRVAGENVGVYGINQGGLGLVSSNYTLNYQGNNLTITKALLNVIADAKTKVYGDADPALTYQVSGLKNGDTAGAVLNGGSLSRVAGENVGVYGINQGGLGLVSSNYTLNYQGNNLTITKALLNVIADAKTKVYGDADPALTYQVSGLKNGDTAGAVLNGGSLSRVAGENVGVYGINQGGLGLLSANYDLSYQGNNLTITKALLNVIADAKTKVYGDADPSLTYQVSGLKNGDTAGAVLNGGSLSRVAGENVGVYGINQGDLALNSGNYDLSYQGNNLTITKALLNVIADAKTKVYGDADPSLTYQVSGLKNGDTAGAVLNGGGLVRVSGENVGNYAIQQGGLGLVSGNYDLAYQGNNLTITKALLNVIADGKTKVYGDADPSLTYQVSGLKNGDTAGAVLNSGSLSRVAGENVGVYGINQGDLALNSGNYDLSYQGNNLTITKALLNVIADAKTKVYGDADPSLTYQVSGLKNGDTAGAVLNGGGLVRVSGENVGNYAIQQGGLGLVSGNYDLAYQGNNLTITKALLNVIADGKTKVYGDADPSLTYQVSGLRNGDSAGSILTGGLNRDAGENVGVYGINQGDLALNSGNYDLSYQGNNLTITKALLNVIADAKTKVYGDADPSLTYQVSGLKNGDTAGAVLNGGSLSRVAGENVGVYGINQGDLALNSGNYDLSYQGNNLTITKALLNVIADAKTKVYGDADPSLTYQVSGLKNGDTAGAVLNGGSLSRVAGENVGVYGINQGDLALNSGNYDLSYQGNNLTITKALLNVIADAKTKVYGDADPSLTYQVSGLKNGDTAGAVLNGGGLVRVSGENVGTYAIQQGGLGLVSGNYDLAYQGNNLTITKALLNVIADAKTKVYGDADPSLTYQVSGLKNGDTAGAVLNGGGLVRVSGENVGNYAIQQGGLGLVSGNYDLAYQGNNLTITKALLNVIADAKTKVYGDADPSLTYQVSGLKNGDTAGAVLNGGSLSRVAGENVGVYGINQGDLALNSGNYDLSYQGNNRTITKALLNVIADAKTTVYGDADPSLTYHVSGLKNGDTAGAVLNGGSLSRVAGENVGVYGINQGGLGLVSANYDLSYQGNNLTITKALLNVIADAKTKVYGDADPSLTYQVSGLKNGDTAGAVLNGGSLSRVAGENVGVYGINQGGLGLVSANYDLSYQGNNLTITKALLNVIADAKTKVYGDADPSLTYQVSGLKNGDTAGAVLNGGSLSRVAGENVGVYGINQGDLALNSGNYDLSYQGNNLTITKALLNVIADAKTKVYGDADPALTYQVSGLKNGDTAGAVLNGGSLSRVAGENVGVYGINQGDLALNSGNYDLSYQGNNLTITKALLNVIADAKTKVYGDADPALTYQVSGLKNGDTAGAVLNGGSLSRVAGENVGVYGINQGDLALNSGNYDLSYQGNNLTITKALLNVIADAKTKVYGDADPALTYQVSGLKNGDTAGAVLNGGSLSRVAGENVGVYGINQGGLALNSGNYDLSYQGNNLTITKALLNVIADAKTKVYGDADPSLTYQVSGLKNGDSAGSILTGGLNRAAGENVGVYGINQGDLALNSGNYDLSYQGNNLTITKALLNVIAEAKTKVYGDADPSLTYQVSGLKNGDSAGSILTGGLNRAAGENVGVYGINQGDLALNSGNYDLSYQGNNLTITKALLNVIADGKTKVYGDADPALTYQVSGLKNGDTAGAVLNGGGLVRVSGENVGNYAIQQGGLGLVSGNYDLAYQGNNLTITKALLNVIADGKTKVYGDADPSLTYQVSGLKNGDTAGAVLNGGGLVRVSGENVGNYAIQQGGLGLVSGNYDLAYQGNDLTITKALLNVFADAKSKQVGTADPALTYQVSGLKNGDSAGQVLAGGLGRVGGEAVGQYDILQGGLALTSGNYQLNYQGNLLSILPLPVTPGDLGQLAALSDLRELQKGRDPDTPGDAVYRTTTLENPFLENPFLRAYALGMDVSDPNLLPATAAGPAEDASAKRVGQFTDRPLRAEAESGAGCSNQSYLADYWSCFNKPLNF
ncbi:MBG domain-containing protein [Pseudomonas aeruginosa]